PPASARNHHPDGSQADDALTINLDQSVEAAQGDDHAIKVFENYLLSFEDKLNFLCPVKITRMTYVRSGFSSDDPSHAVKIFVSGSGSSLRIGRRQRKGLGRLLTQVRSFIWSYPTNS
ncbi:hypothetical protein, partial [Ruegeria sp. HKCCA4008]|uniref:hypothetical protein n=1 Tax=Ruegeria sp. HKCCA4008 TaxID=2682999 RepID=UPI0020C51857